MLPLRWGKSLPEQQARRWAGGRAWRPQPELLSPLPRLRLPERGAPRSGAGHPGNPGLACPGSPRCSAESARGRRWAACGTSRTRETRVLVPTPTAFEPLWPGLCPVAIGKMRKATWDGGGWREGRENSERIPSPHLPDFPRGPRYRGQSEPSLWTCDAFPHPKQTLESVGFASACQLRPPAALKSSV